VSASRREDIETQVVARITANVPELASSTASAAAAGFTFLDGPKPKALVVCSRFTKTGTPEFYFGVVRNFGVFRIEVFIATALSGPPGAARLGAGGGYDLAQRVDSFLTGFQPVLSTVENVIPMVLEDDELFGVDQTNWETCLTYALAAKVSYGP